MSTNIGEIALDATIDASQYEQGAKNIDKLNKKIVDSVDTASDNIEEIGDAGSKATNSLKDSFSNAFNSIDGFAEKLGLSLPKKLAPIAAIGVSVAGIAGVFKSGIETAISQIDVQGTLDAQLGKGSVAAENAGKVAGTLYREGWGESLADVANVAAQVSQIIRGIGEDDLQTVTRATEVWSSTFDADAGESIRGVNVLMTKFGLSAEQATDLMTKGMQNGLNYTDELADNLSEYSGRWAEAGMTASEYFSILQAGVDSGAYQLDKVGDFLNEFLTSLTDGRMEAGLGDFSQGTQDVFHAFQDGKATAEDVLNAVIGELGTMTDKTKEASIASTLWSSLGEDNALGMIEALANVPDSYKDIAGATNEAAESTMSIGQQWESLKRTISGVLGDVFTPFVSEVVGGLQNMAKEFESFANSVDWTPLQQGLQAVGVILNTTFSVVGTVLKGVLDVLTVFGQWFDNHADSITTSLIMIGTGFAVFKIAGVIQTVVTALEGFSLATQAATLAQAALNFVMEMNPLVLIISLIAAVTAGLIYFFTQTDTGKQAWQDFCTTMQTLWNNLSQFFQDTWNSICQFFEDAKTNITNAWNSLTEWISTIPNKITGFFTGIADKISGFFEDAKQKVVDKFNSIVDNVKSIPDKIRDVFSNAGELLKNAGRDLVFGFINGITEKIGHLVQTCKNMAGQAVSTVKSFLHIGSPSKVFANEIGKWIPAGVEVGVKRETPHLLDTVETMSVSMVDAAKIPQTYSATTSLPSLSLSDSGASSVNAGNIVIENMTVRNDNDIRLIAQELYKLQKRDARRV